MYVGYLAAFAGFEVLKLVLFQTCISFFPPPIERVSRLLLASLGERRWWCDGLMIRTLL